MCVPRLWNEFESANPYITWWTSPSQFPIDAFQVSSIESSSSLLHALYTPHSFITKSRHVLHRFLQPCLNGSLRPCFSPSS